MKIQLPALEKIAGRIVFATSDLHVGSPFSRPEVIRIIEEGIAHSHMAVFCGDIMEGTMRYLPFAERLARSKRALSHWAEAGTKNGQVKPQFYLYGNHEVPFFGRDLKHSESGDFCAEIAAHCAQFPHVSFHQAQWIQLGDAAFTHGNRELGYLDHLRHERWASRIINIPVQIFGPGMPTELLLSRKNVVKKMHAAFAGHELEGPVNHVIFGHTHTPFTGFSVPGLRLGGDADVQFHNTGVAYRMRDLMNPLFIDYDAAGRVGGVRPANLEYLLGNGRGNERG